jgi:hypothetical protein
MLTSQIILQNAQDTLISITSIVSDNQDEIIKEGSKWFNKITLKFIIRLTIDLLSLAIVLWGIYYPRYKNKAFFLTYAIFNIVIFLITYLLNKVDLSLGAAFGLFAVFGIMRYRSEDISIKNLTYLFIVIAIGLISAIAKGSWEEISFYNFIILLITFILESGRIMRVESSKLIYYDNVELLKPEKREQLLNDLKARTGYTILRIEIERIDFLKDSAVLRVYFFEE